MKKIYRNMSQSWQTTAIDMEDTPYQGILLISNDPKHLTDLENPDNDKVNSIDIIIIEPSVRRGAKVLWDNHFWRINHAVSLFPGISHSLIEIEICRPKKF